MPVSPSSDALVPQRYDGSMPVTDRAADVVEGLEADERFSPQLVETIYLPPTPERFGELDPPLPGALERSLAAVGATRLWSHQTEGLAALRRGENVLITTPTASGKSLVFQLPVLEEALAGGGGRALFLYPLKALGRDQMGKLEMLASTAGIDPEGASGGMPFVAVYDGDTKPKRRAEIKRRFPRIIVSNPDMLHAGILSSWQGWSPFLRELRWIVLDELHTYRGIFGSHFHHVLQRLTRLCRAEGADPVLVASSATAVNAGEFAARLAGRDFHWVRETGSPQQGRHFLLFRPAASPYTLSLHLLVELLQKGLKTIVFTKARRITELLYSWLRQQEPTLASKVASYRSGFLPEERRKIERDLFDGRLNGVISTSALEMGIDVGGLDACILVGFPGSVMATWQRSGRVGRAGRESITALVALPDALDQYLLEHPLELIERPYESLIVDPSNEPVAKAHLVCAAAELPLHRDRDSGYLEPHAPLVGDLLRAHTLVESAETGEIGTRRKRPQREIGLRGAGETTTILDTTSGRLIGTVDGSRALRECHPGAIYLHAGNQHLVRELDLEAGKAHAEPVTVDYYTMPLTQKETEVLEVLAESRVENLEAFLGRLRVTEKVVGYERRRLRSQEAIDQHELDLPPVRFETVGLWWAAPRPLEDELRDGGAHFMGALHAAEHATISLLPLHTLCDRGDVGGISIPLHPQLQCGAVFIYDGHPGGVGISARAFEDLPALLGRVCELLERCDCEAGCPSCVQSPKCGNGNRPLDKDGALRLLRILLGKETVAGAAAGKTRIALGAATGEQAMDGWTEPMNGRAAQPGPGAGAAVSTGRRKGSRAVSGPVSPLEEPEEPLPPPPIPVPEYPRRTLLFDLETQRSAEDVGSWRNAHRMLVSVGVACHLQDGEIRVFREPEVADLVAWLDSADAVIGFNSRRFDYRVLEGYTGIDYERRWPTLDLLDDIHRRLGFRLSLAHLADATLGVEKTADGLQSLEWVRAGQLDRVEEYCRRDVEILRDLYLFGRRMGFVVYRDGDEKPVKLPVEW